MGCAKIESIFVGRKSEHRGGGRTLCDRLVAYRIHNDFQIPYFFLLHLCSKIVH